MKMQSRSRGLRELCRLLGFSRQAYYQYQKLACKSALEEDLLIRQVLHHRILQPRLGGRKLHDMMKPFMEDHDLYIGRDVLFDLLRKMSCWSPGEGAASPARPIPITGCEGTPT